jgi:hypothetical protein
VRRVEVAMDNPVHTSLVQHHENNFEALGAIGQRPGEKDGYPLFLLKYLSTIGINEGNITGLLISPHQIPDRRLKPEGVPKCKG